MKAQEQVMTIPRCGSGRNRSVSTLLMAGLCCWPLIVFTGVESFFWVDDYVFLVCLLSVVWGFALAAHVALCRREEEYAVLCVGGIFIVSLIACGLVSKMYMNYYGALHSYSDDQWYGLQAARFTAALRLENLDIRSSLEIFFADWTVKPSLMAWPMILGFIGYFSDGSEVAMHTIAMVLNSAALAVMFAVFLRYATHFGEYSPKMLFLCFLMIAPEMLVYVGNDRKDIVLTLAVMTVCLTAHELIEKHRHRLTWAVVAMAGLAYIAGSRPTYAVVPAGVAYYLMSRRGMLGVKIKLAIAVFGLLVAWKLGLAEKIMIRGSNPFQLREIMTHDVGMSGGMGAAVYNIPLVGGVLYYLICPPPINPFADMPFYGERLFRSLGTIFYVGAFCYSVFCIVRSRRIRTQIYPLAIPFVILFGASVFITSEWRYKMPTNPFLGLVFACAVESCRRKTGKTALSPMQSQVHSG